MKSRIILTAVALTLALITPAAFAHVVRAESVPHVFMHDGTCKKASNWYPATKPTLEDPVTIPAGKHLELKEVACKTGSLTVAGSVVGAGKLEVAGGITVEGTGSLEGVTTPVTTFGMGTLRFNGTLAPALLIEGTEELGEPLEAVSIDIDGGFYTNSHNVTTQGQLYTHIKFPLTHLWLGTSTVTSSVFESYEPDETDQQSAESTINVCATTRSSGGFVKVGEGGVFYGQEQIYGTVNMDCIEPFSATNWTGDTLNIHPTEGPFIVSGGSTITVQHLEGSGEVVDGEPNQPSPLRPAVIDCGGCTPPPTLHFAPNVEVR